jgi:hypothetical protein
MSDIKVGDLVMVVKPSACCGRLDFIGKTFIALEFKIGLSNCVYCGHREDRTNIVGGEFMFHIHRLIKIDPPALPESMEREKALEV